MMINLFGEESNRYTLLQANTPRTSPRSSYQNQNHNTNNNISQQSSAPGYFNYHQTHLTDQKRNGMPTRPLFRQMYHRFRYFSKSYPLVFRFFILLISTLILILIYSWLSDLPPGQIFSLTSVQINPKSVSSVNPKAQHNNPLPISNKLLKSSKSSTSHQSIKDSDSKTLIVSNSSLTTTVNGHDHGRNPVLVNEKMSSDSKTLLHSGSSHSTIPNLHSNQNPSSLSKPSSSSSSTLPSQSFVKITSSRPIVPHPLRPLPIPPPSSAKVCDRCGCSSDHQIKREFDQPDPLIINLNLVDHLSSSVSRSQSELFDPNQLSLVNKVWVGFFFN
ncbi:expressed protein [Phakopsora pachyrhizi]|uniref:Expressed protein n=1 Tax=Phakopsora pachyrhizi TaxID=170000 RepID=A0AAV0AHU4_PHAPC|nr:expressed protein [Phakopsora pachyrhizi]